MRKFYYEHDEFERTWDVIQADGGSEHGQYYDALMFSCVTEQDAVDTIELLMQLQEGEP